MRKVPAKPPATTIPPSRKGVGPAINRVNSPKILPIVAPIANAGTNKPQGTGINNERQVRKN